MFLKQFYLECLSQASYMIGSKGEAAVVDPRRDVDEYLEEAERQGVTIRHILETHFHADFVSGHRELAARTGAEIYFGSRARPQYHAALLADGDEVRVGTVIIRALQTPGHTPESVCYLVIDTEQGVVPQAVLTGDTLFVGEVGRPDLVGSDASAEEMAGLLYDSIHRQILPLPDSVIVYPGHGPGSACGKNIGPDTSSTIGKEKKFNYALAISDRESFVRAISAGLPAPPRYFRHDVNLNREGAAPLEDVLESLRPLAADDVARRAESGEALALDTRSVEEYGRGHVPGSVNVGLQGRYAAWVGTVVDPTTPLLLVTDPGRQREAAMRLARVGYENIVGFLDGGIAAWRSEGREVRDLDQIDVQALHQRLGDGPLRIVDVRGPDEWAGGHIAGATHRPLADLSADQELMEDGPLAVICGSGYRSSIACSLLERMGTRAKLINVAGGMTSWREAGLPETRPAG